MVQNSGTSTKGIINPVITEGNGMPEIGIVEVIGKGIKPVDFKVGDKIAYRKYTDNKIKVDGVEYNFINFKDILAVLDRKEAN